MATARVAIGLWPAARTAMSVAFLHMPSPRKRRVHYVPSTHWDREWHQPLFGFRFGLVRLLDRICAVLETGALPGPFQTDGQSILLEDYLEIRPEQRQRIETLCQQGRLAVGPWYSMPDEFTVSGEAIIRNLLVGRAQAREFGAEPATAGYVPDMFGHNSQLPQIFAHCGIRTGILWRGINDDARRNFLWTGADGTVLPCHKFARQGYGAYQAHVGRAHEPERRIEDDPAEFRRLLFKFLGEEAAATDVGPILLHDSCDHQEWSAARYTLMVAALADSPDYELVHSDFDAYGSELLAEQRRIKGRLKGELRDPGRAIWGDQPLEASMQWLIPGVLSSRVHLKQANARCQSLLTQWAEPFTVCAHHALGLEFAPGFLALAWRKLLQNHAHDSMDGCSIDQVHRDMMHRFDDIRIIADKLATEATSRIAASIEGDISTHELRVTVFNPLPRDFSGVTELALEIPAAWPGFNEFFGFEPKPGFTLHDANGREIPYQRLSQAMNRLRGRFRETKFPENVNFHRIGVAVQIDVPAVGHTTLTVRAVKPDTPTRHPEVPGLATSERAMANAHIAVQIEANGTLTLTDRATGNVYRDLLTFEDTADIGDGWYHGVAVNDQTFVSSAAPADIALVHNGPLATVFRIRTTMRVPRQFDFAAMTRAPEFTELVIDSRLCLRRDQTHLEVETTVHNEADDHRVRVLLPSGAKTDRWLADTPFDVVERPIALRKDNHLYREMEVETKPQQTWSAVHDAKRGLAVVADGSLLETAVRDLPDRPLALTLFRGTRRTVLTNGEPEGQLRGALTFRYAIKPLRGAPDRTALALLGQRLAGGLRVVQLQAADLSMFRETSTRPPTAGLLRLEGDAVLTCLRAAEAATELRFYNPHESRRDIRVVLTDPQWRPTQAVRTDGEGNPLVRLRLQRRQFSLRLRPKEIATVRLS